MKQIHTTKWQKIGLVLFGVVLCLVMLECGLRIGGYVFSYAQERHNRAALARGGEYRILCLGESTTAGQWPPYLDEWLNECGLEFTCTVIDKGRPASGTAYILSHLQDYLDEYEPHMVIVMMGINDRLHEEWWPRATQRGAIAQTKPFFIQNFQIYKIMQLVWLHVLRKLARTEVGPHFAVYDEYESATYHSLLRAEPLWDGTPPEDNSKNKIAALWHKAQKYEDHFQFEKAAAVYSNLVERQSDNYNAYIALANCYMHQGLTYLTVGKWEYVDDVLVKAIFFFKRAIQRKPTNEEGYIALGAAYMLVAEKYFQMQNYDEVGWSYYHRAMNILLRGQKFNPNSARIYYEIGNCYNEVSAYKEIPEYYEKAESMFLKAIQLNSKDFSSRDGLGRLYGQFRYYNKQEKLLRESMQYYPEYFSDDNMWLLLRYLEECYVIQKKYGQAAEVSRKGIRMFPQDSIFYRKLAMNNMRQKKYIKAARNFQKAELLELRYYEARTRTNYQKLKEIVQSRGIQLVCTQYPMRSVEPLKKTLEPYDSVIFVDNEKLFKEAVMNEEYETYFLYYFGGDFGHCTAKGNKLLAENIGSVILEQYFRQDDVIKIEK
ncbi:MAG: tetratricopeptide repeat protein [Candidatus Omnitrophica bacterium]|nr:tetratricopeptide repeat protein [Candidatus Omnitrophota bacterium]